jgi:hypothetical protein
MRLRWGESVDGGLAFTTSAANGVLDVRLADGQSVAVYLSRAGHEPHRTWTSLHPFADALELDLLRDRCFTPPPYSKTGEGKMRRHVLTTVVVVSLALSLGSLVDARERPTVETSPVSFELTSATCSNLPAGTVLTGSGTQKSITTTRTDQDGIVTVTNSTHARGTATDQVGNKYVFNYSVAYRATLEGGVYSGFISDAFALAGRGPVRLNNGFVGDFVSDFATFFRVPNVISSHGDPLDLATGDVHCDPL